MPDERKSSMLLAVWLLSARLHSMHDRGVAKNRRTVMARMFIDCRKYPSEKNCTVSIAADTRQELMEAVVQHAVAVHGHTDGPQLREMIGQAIQQESAVAA
jgi:predicted small metal-binding protein